MKKTSKSKLEKLANEALNDGEQEAWETGKLGRDIKHMKIAPADETQKFLKEKDTFSTSIRLPKELTENLRILAKKNGLNYQTYLKMVLTQHVSEKLKKSA